MKLALAIVHDRDVGRLTPILLEAGYKFAKIGSTGGFLREGNTTLLIGVDAADVERLLNAVGGCCQTREQYSNVISPDAIAGASLPAPIKVLVGGAVVFVLDVERFERP